MANNTNTELTDALEVLDNIKCICACAWDERGQEGAVETALETIITKATAARNAMQAERCNKQPFWSSLFYWRL